MVDLVEGKFYWVQIVFDPDTDQEWENKDMPARFAGYVNGDPTWNYLGVEGISTWDTRWVGEEITQ